MRAHTDGAVRDLRLALASAADGIAPQKLKELIDALDTRLRFFHDEVTRQARAAQAAGERVVTLCVPLPAAALHDLVQLGDAYDEADRFARHAQVLSLEASPVLRVFRRWILDALIAQIHALRAGSPRPSISSFEATLERGTDPPALSGEPVP